MAEVNKETWGCFTETSQQDRNCHKGAREGSRGGTLFSSSPSSSSTSSSSISPSISSSSILSSSPRWELCPKCQKSFLLVDSTKLKYTVAHIASTRKIAVLRSKTGLDTSKSYMSSKYIPSTNSCSSCKQRQDSGAILPEELLQCNPLMEKYILLAKRRSHLKPRKPRPENDCSECLSDVDQPYVTCTDSSAKHKCISSS